MTDVAICPDCEEIVEDRTYHPSCCPHDAVETTDEADGVVGGGVAHLYVSRCHQCGAEVRPTDNPYGSQWWETI